MRLFAPTPKNSPYFYPIVSSLEELRAIASLGFGWVQLRKKGGEADFYREAAQTFAQHRQHEDQKIILNDSIEHALACGFDGVHLGQEDLQEQREHLPEASKKGLILGLSSHSCDEARLALECKPTYLAVGAIFASATKPQVTALRHEQTQAVVQWIRQHSDLPIIAIGGISNDNAREVFKRGFDSVAFISWVHELIEAQLQPQQLAANLLLEPNCRD